MLDRFTQEIDFHGKALKLRADRQQVLSNNIANADTPGFRARDFDFSKALAAAASGNSSNPRASGGSVASTNGAHLPGIVRDESGATSLSTLKYRTAQQASIDGNTVNIDSERANFAENTLHYEASLRFINDHMRQILSAIRGD